MSDVVEKKAVSQFPGLSQGLFRCAADFGDDSVVEQGHQTVELPPDHDKKRVGILRQVVTLVFQILHALPEKGEASFRRFLFRPP